MKTKKNNPTLSKIYDKIIANYQCSRYIIADKKRNSHLMFNDKSFVNLTSPTYDVKDCLSFGDKFSVEHCKDEVPIFKILKDVEYYIRVNFLILIGMKLDVRLIMQSQILCIKKSMTF